LRKVVFEVKSISKTYSGIKVLENVGFDIKEGEVHALVGENGAGKSTLIKIVAGVETPDKGGEIYFNGKLQTHLTPIKTMQMGLSVIYQDISMFPNLSVAENICIADAKGAFVDWNKVKEKAGKVLDSLGTKIDLNSRLGSLTIGKQQLVAIARALAFNAGVIIMDEPTSALSSSEVETLLSTINKLKKENVSIVYITHKLVEVFVVADRISVLRDGKVVSSDVMSNYTSEKLIHDMVGRELRFERENKRRKSDDILFETKSLTCEPYFRNISINLKKNEILGITGLVGAGRSEFAQTVYGLHKAQSGEVFLQGKKLKINKSYDAIRKGIAYLAEDRRSQSMFFGQNMIMNITVAAMYKLVNKFRLIKPNNEITITREFIEKLQIKPNRPYIKIENLSGGNQQKVIVGRWLNTDPKVLIVDEPTTGIDVSAKVEIHKILRNLAENGVGIILISSDLPEVLAISDRIVVMRNGNIVTEASSMESTQESILEHGIMG